jgi:glutathionylspermidine synthase
MERVTISPRPDWQKIVESQGLLFHHTDGEIYWKESAYYKFTMREIESIETATADLWSLCLDAVDHVISKKRYTDLNIPPVAIPLIERSWEEEHPAIYGRMDLAYDPGQYGRPPKLLEFNADTPTMLLEAAVVQWQWLQDVKPISGADQFNSIHEKLIEKWRELAGGYIKQPFFFGSLNHVEDLMTATYLEDTARQAGIETRSIRIEDIGWDGMMFRAPDGTPIESIFKLYPWEWMWQEEFGPHLAANRWTTWMEPAWRAILSNKGILAILWQMFPDHPNLLPAQFDNSRGLPAWVRKPLHGREGQNIKMLMPDGARHENGGRYGDQRMIYQEYCEVPRLDGQYPVIGSWLIDGAPAGIGVRESVKPITVNESPFVPHLIA